MPRSMQEILENADALAKQFEDYDPKPEHEGQIDPLTAVRLAVYKRAEAEKILAEAVAAARSDKVTWGQLGDALGTSGEAVRQRYAGLLGDLHT